MGQLDIRRGGSTFILPGYRSYVHAYSNNAYYHSCQEQLSNSHAYMFFSFSEVRPRDFNNLRHSKGQNVPTTVERQVITSVLSEIVGCEKHSSVFSKSEKVSLLKRSNTNKSQS
jgi:hypothetical protein